MIEIIPAIDIIDGQCVRLTRGDYATRQVYGDAAAIAQTYAAQGCQRIHIVDLDGAREGRIVNLPIIETICKRTSLVVDCGGGLRTTDDLRRLFDVGVRMVSVGSVAITQPALYAQWIETFGPERLILCADTRDGKISIHGWKEDSATPLTAFLASHLRQGTRNVLLTDITRDGTLSGPAVVLYGEVMSAYPDCYLIASGGVRSMEDIVALEQAHVPAVVIGKALYEGTISIDQLRERCWRRE